MTPIPRPNPELSSALVHLAKGPVHEEDSPNVWRYIMKHAADISGISAHYGLSLEIDREEKYAFVRQPLKNTFSRTNTEDDEDILVVDPEDIPPLVSRIPLSAPVSYLLLKLRKRLYAYDADVSGDCFGKLLVPESEIVEMCAPVFGCRENDDQSLRRAVAGAIRKVEDAGFLREIKSVGTEKTYEIRRILKAFIDGQWLDNMDALLDAYAGAANGARNVHLEEGKDYE